MVITQTDYNLLQAGKISLQDLCYRYNLSESKARSQIRKYHAPRRLWTTEDRDQLRQDLVRAIPYDRHSGVTQVLKAWNVKNITSACQLLGIRSLAELRLAPNGGVLRALLHKHGLKLVNNILFAPSHRGAYHEDRQIVVDRDALMNDPEGWFKDNLDIINSTCYKTRTKTLRPKTPPTAQLLRRYETVKKTTELLNAKMTTREIKRLAGTAAYVTRLRSGVEIFTDEELDILRKAGVII